MAQDTAIVAETVKLTGAPGGLVLNVSGTSSLTGSTQISGNVSMTGNESISGNLAVTGSTTLSSTVSASSFSGGLNFDFVSGAANAGLSTTASSQSLSVSGSLITMTSGLSAGIGPHTIYVSANSTSATCTLTPTSSASTSGVFQNGVEITVINLGVSGSRIVIPVSGAGSYNTDTIVISSGHAVRFFYNAALQTWIPVAN